MSTETYVKKLAFRIVSLIVLFIFLTGFLAAAESILANDLAVSQLENNDMFFIIMEIYHNVISPVVYGLIIAIFIYNAILIIYNTYKFIKYKEEN